MRFSSRTSFYLGSLVMLLSLASLLHSAPTNAADQRKQARDQVQKGNFKDGYEVLKTLCHNPESDPQATAEDLPIGVRCLQQLGRLNEVDAFLEGTIAAHGKHWQVLRSAAGIYLGQLPKHGFIIAGKFERGDHRGGGEIAHVIERDRTRALQLFWQAMPLAVQDDRKPQVAAFFNEFANGLLNNRGWQEAWRLQALTDLAQLPDHEAGWPTWESFNGASVDAAGKPIFYSTPASWDAAQNDGQRWRWLLAQAIENDPQQKYAALWNFAHFMEQIYGVQSMANWGYGGLFSRLDDDDTKQNESGTYALHTLRDEETIAKLANGIKRFELPDEFNFLKIYRQLADDAAAQNHYREHALRQLAQVYANRRQYVQAAKCWEENIEKFGPGENNHKKQQLAQIVGNWGQFENTPVQPAREGARVDFRFRNARQVKFIAQAIKVDLLLSDLKAYLKSDPGQLDWQKINIDNLGYRLVHQNQQKYVGEQIANWSLDLEPRPNHFDRRITVTTPLQKSGAYLVTAQLENGNVSTIVLWVADTAIVQKNLDGKTMFYAADAVSGQALPALNLEFFGYRQEHLGNNRWRISTTNFAELTNNDGITTPDPRDLKNDYNWLITARGGAEGRFAHFGFIGVWTGQRHDEEYKAVKVFAITDRPVYRPNQKVFFKMWVRKTQYDLENHSDFAKQSFAVEIHNPQGEKIYANTLTTDEYAGLTGELALPVDAPLGMYQITLQRHQNNEHIHGQIAFRVEEYKKPEYEVTVQAPTEPVMLGEKITAKINAKYYFGSPVVNAKVKYKITRVKHNQNWFPRMPWDWCYEPGYWWFAYDYDWYPGWKQWAGCMRPIPVWWGRFSNDPPEVLADVETKIGPEGTLDVEIDTALAKELHANFDHSYSITAEVTDESRRLIVGQGNVLVARKPFKVFTWVDRGYYRLGEEIVAHFKAQTLDNQPVVGTGEVQLFKISYEKDAPVETLVQSWPVNTNAEGIAEQKMLASAAGQYRVSYKLTDKKSHTITGGYIFTIVGAGFNGHEFKFNPIELIPEKREYAPGEKVKLQINVDRTDATVLLFIRPANGIYLPPQVIRMTGKSAIEEIEVVKRDMPNFFVEAVTIAGGKVFNDLKEIVVPPEKRILNVEVLPSAKEYKPGEKATVKVRLTDHTGENFVGSTVVTVYDKAVEYISGGSNVPEIKEFFWKWRRHHHPQTPHNLQRWSHNLGLPNKPGMSFLGVFGASVADEGAIDELKMQARGVGGGLGAVRRKGMAMNMLADGGGGGAPMAGAAPASAAFFAGDKLEKASADANAVENEVLQQVGGATPPTVEPSVRTNFADTAFWRATLNTNANGEAEVEFTMPENLSSWKMKVWGLGHGTKVGSSDVEVVTRKNILVRLQAPRFFVQKDEVVLSANVHNYLDREKEVTVVLDLPGNVLKSQSETTVKVNIPAGGEKRVDWRCQVLQEGEAVVRIKALTDEESDAMEMKFPSYVHGLLKMEAWAGTVRPDREKATVAIRVPKERRVEQSVLEIRYSPTLAGAMVDALPYLAEYPYGCTEQTLNRFLPSVITQKTLLQMNVNLAAIREKRTNLNAQEIGDDRARAKQWKRFDRNPVFEEDELSRMVKEGVKALTEMQCSDGGWGWFSGTHERSWPHTTAVVVHGLQIAQQNDVTLVPGVLERGLEWLKRYQAAEIAKLKRGEREPKVHPWKAQADDLDSLVHMILVDAGQASATMREYLYRDRVQLSVYAKAMFGLALHKTGQAEQLAMILKNIEQFVVEDAENETAYLKMPENTYWWYWYGSEVEANAYYLKLLAHTDAKGTRAPRLVKYLLNNRKHGTYWNSTRDTALCVEAFADFIRLSGEMKPNMVVEVWLDGEKRKEVTIDESNLFTYDNKFVLTGADVKDGAHEIELRRRGTGPVYFNAYLTNFTLEDHITQAGLEVKVDRRVYKLQPVEKKVQVEGTRGQVVEQKVEKFERIPLENMSKLNSGDLVEVELIIDSKNDYEYLLFEDKKAAGFEAVEVRSGYTGNGLGAYVEFRDNRVAFLVRHLARGKHSVSYRLRAEIPGKFSALPAQASAMYAPELKGNSDEIKLLIEDAP